MLKFKENDIAVHCITGREYLVTSIRENKCGQRVVELIGHKCNIVRDIRTDENGNEYIVDEIKIIGCTVEEIRIVPVDTRVTLNGVEFENIYVAWEKSDKLAELMGKHLPPVELDENNEVILREFTPEEIEEAFYKTVIANPDIFTVKYPEGD